MKIYCHTKIYRKKVILRISWVVQEKEECILCLQEKIIKRPFKCKCAICDQCFKQYVSMPQTSLIRCFKCRQIITWSDYIKYWKKNTKKIY